jgi:hypothetical protein
MELLADTNLLNRRRVDPDHHNIAVGLPRQPGESQIG